MPSAPSQRAHVLIPTHTPRHLPLVLAALGAQSRAPDRIIVSCDTDDPAIGDVISTWSARTGREIRWVRRAHMGEERLCQVRNNGVRHLVETLGETTGRLIILDGDMLASPSLVEQHLALGEGFDLVYPYRVNLDEETTASLDPEAILAGAQAPPLTDADRRALAKRHRRYRKQLILRTLRAGPLHKPKLLGGHVSIDLALYRALNGFDEEYRGSWGFKDDEFAYRAARRGASVRIAVRRIIAWHLWHESRQPDTPMAQLPTARRFERRKDLPLVCEHGLSSPLPQHPVHADAFAGGADARVSDTPPARARSEPAAGER